MPKSDFQFHTSLRVRWMECDAQGIVFNGAYMGYLEVGQAEYFRNLGFSIYRVAQRGYFDTAVARTVLEQADLLSEAWVPWPRQRDGGMTIEGP